MPRPTVATAIPHPTVSPSSFHLPEPALSFTIPSVHDDITILECRIYHPHSLAPSSRAPPWRKHAAIVAHPYASLGGCYDDAVVETISAALLLQGFVVGTFNFRGAGKSTGRTSWTGRAEGGDYMSFAGFLYYYVHYLDPFRPQRMDGRTSSAAPTTSNENAPAQAGPVDAPVLLLGGYSYGAMITKLLPPLETILVPFATPPTASAAADIRLRAQHLAEKQNTILASVRAALAESPMSPRKAAFGPLRVGGDEDLRRSQEHGRRSFSLDAEDKIRKGVAELMQKAKSHQLGLHRKSKDQVAAVKEESDKHNEKEPDSLAPVLDLVRPRVAYLLVSPPVGWVATLVTMNLGGFWGKRPKSTKAEDHVRVESRDTKDPWASVERQELVDHPTLAIYGDTDVFVGAKKYREWASKLQSYPRSHFRAHEISTAGHFYMETGTMQRVANAVRAFAAELVAP